MPKRQDENCDVSKRCANGHLIEGHNALTRGDRNGRKRWRCRICFNAYKREHMRKKRAAMSEKEREEVRSYYRDYSKRPDVRERQQAYNRRPEVMERKRRYELTPERRAAKKAAQVASRRRNGVLPRAERHELQRATRPPKVEKPKIPFEIHQAWSAAKPGSMIRRLFPRPQDLKNAIWDPDTQTLRRAA